MLNYCSFCINISATFLTLRCFKFSYRDDLRASEKLKVNNFINTDRYGRYNVFSLLALFYTVL